MITKLYLVFTIYLLTFKFTRAKIKVTVGHTALNHNKYY
jgi:hypothetical protein